MIEYACKKCHRIVKKRKCPTCSDVDVSKNWKGFVAILDPDKSKIAKNLKIDSVGLFALRVR